MPDAFAPDEAPIAFDPFAGSVIETSFPSTDAQREIWTATRMGDDASLAFNEAVEIHLTGELDEAALRGALRDLVARHESLRVTFTENGLTAIVSEAPEDVALEVHDWSLRADVEQRLHTLRVRIVSEPFDLVTGPLVRFSLARLHADEHVVMITAHHIVCDGWSFGVLATELATLYSAAVRGQVPMLGDAERFSDYAIAQQGEEARAAVADAERYWLARFEGELPVLDLPVDHPRQPLRSYRADREDWALSPELSAAIAKASVDAGVSLFATLFGGYGVLLHRLSGQRDVVIGVPAAGQAAAGVPGLVGHLVSMLPMRVAIDQAQSVSALLKSVRTAVLDGYDQQSLTFGSLLQRLPITRDPSRPPLISVAFNLDRGIGADALPFAGLRGALRSVPRRFENFDLFVNAVQLDGVITLECQYNSDLLDRETVRRWLAAYELLLQGVAHDTGAAVSTLRVVEASQVDALTGGPAYPLPEGAALAVHALIEAQVRRSPDAVAVEYDGSALTYRELDAQANRLAHHLRSLGVRRGVHVGLCVERSLELFVGVLGILKAGGAYVPLDPGYPVERLSLMSDDIGLSVLVTEAAVHAETPLRATHVVLLDAHAPIIAAHSDAPLPVDDDSGFGESPAYVIYTSGSTGKPNGVVVPHRSVVNLLLSVRDTPGMSDRDVVVAITTLSFDIAASEVLLPLTVGARIVLASREIAADGARLRDLLERRQVTFLDATPATYRLLLAAGWEGDRAMRVICTGEAMPRDLAELLCPIVAEVWNGYGPTETTVWSTFWRVESPVTRILIGRPVGNTRVYVLDAQLQPVPIGVKGELFIGGRGVSSGYFQRPELTAHRFLADPFSPLPGARMYRTGDVVRFLPDGNIDYLGRNDNQVKVRGYRIELGEIEDALGQCPGVGACAVLARSDRPGDLRLVAYFVLASERSVSDGQLRAHLKRTLPDYMVPSVFVRRDMMPLTPSGKIDRKALPAPNADDVTSDAEFVEPRTESEELVAALWREALGLGRISIRDDFFTLGGHSLLASQVLARLRRDHRIELSFRKFFEAPTIERFAELVDGARASETPVGPVRIPRRDGATSAPLTVIQERLWLLEELDPTHRTTHNLPAAWRLRGALDVPALRGALDDFARRHESLRTGFHVIDGARRQLVAADVTMPFEEIDLSGLPDEEREDAATRLMLDAQETPFDIARPPLFRVALIRLSADEHVLFTLRHALIWDGWSFDIFIGELAECYRARVAGTAPALPAVAISYGDFAAWQREWLAGPEAARQMEWWRDYLSGELPVLQLPTDRPRPSQSSYRGDRTYVTFSGEEVVAMRAFARAHDATLYTVLFAAFNVLLHRYTGQRDILVGSPARARSWAETENVVGPFVNMLVLRSHLAPEMTFAELMAQVRDVTLSALSRSEIPFEMVASRPPVLRALFSMQDARTRPLAAGDLSILQVPEPQRYAANDLMLWTMESPAGLRAVLNFSSELFDRATADRLLQHLRTLLIDLLRDAARPIGKARLVDDAEALLVTGARDASPPPPFADVTERLAQLGAESPDSPAIVAGREQLTRGELDARASDLARALRTLLPNGGTVGIVLESGLARAVAMLGAFKAGCAVLFLDEGDAEVYSVAVVAAGGAQLLISEAGVGLPWDAPPDMHVLSVRADGRIAAPVAFAVTQNETVAGTPDAARAGALVLHAPRDSGAPTCSIVSHGHLAHLVHDVMGRLELTSTDVFVATLAPTADAAPIELLAPLVAGATLVVAGDDVAGDHERFSSILHERGVTVGNAPLATWRGVASLDWRAARGFRAIVADEGIASNDVGDLRALGCRTFTAASDAHSGLWYAAHEVRDDDVGIVAGRPIGGAQVIVREGGGEPAALAVWGELYVSAPPAGDGERSVTSSQPHALKSVATVPEAIRATGISARRRVDGSIETVGPTADCVWLDGGRLSPRAVETAMMLHPALSAACVRVQRDNAGRPRLVAYVVPRGGADYTDSELRALVRERLPRRAVPSVIVEVDALPTRRDGAVDDSLLPSPFAPALSERFVAPRTDAERLLADLWGELLEVKRVGVADNFFALGGYSLLCFRVIDRVQEATGVRLSPRALLTGTLEQAAAHLERLRDEAPPVTKRTFEPPSGVLRRFKTLLTGVD